MYSSVADAEYQFRRAKAEADARAAYSRSRPHSDGEEHPSVPAAVPSTPAVSGSIGGLLSKIRSDDLLILAMLLPLGLWSRSAEPFSAGLYILTPFLLSTFVGLYTIRTWAGREGLYACVGESAGISFFVTFSHEIAPFIYWESCLWIWAAAALILCVGNGKQCIELLKRTEELVWS